MRRPDQIVAHRSAQIVQRRNTANLGVCQGQKISVIAPTADQYLARRPRLDQLCQRNRMIGIQLDEIGLIKIALRSIGAYRMFVARSLVHQLPAINRTLDRFMLIHPVEHFAPRPGHIAVIGLQRRIGRSIAQGRPALGIAPDILRIAARVNHGQLIARRRGRCQKPLHLRVQRPIGVEGIFVELHPQIVHQRQRDLDAGHELFGVALHALRDQLHRGLPRPTRAISRLHHDVDHRNAACRRCSCRSHVKQPSEHIRPNAWHKAPQPMPAQADQSCVLGST